MTNFGRNIGSEGTLTAAGCLKLSICKTSIILLVFGFKANRQSRKLFFKYGSPEGQVKNCFCLREIVFSPAIMRIGGKKS